MPAGQAHARHHSQKPWWDVDMNSLRISRSLAIAIFSQRDFTNIYVVNGV